MLNDAFWKWFGDSKVVDTNGDPLVVYHGTDESFSIFKEDHGMGIFVTPDPNLASKWAMFRAEKRSTANAISLFVSIKNPKIFSNSDDDISEYIRTGSNFRKLGFDGVIIVDKKTKLEDLLEDFYDYIFIPEEGQYRISDYAFEKLHKSVIEYF